MVFSEVKKVLIIHKKDLLRRGVRALSLFGSVVRNESSKARDIDVLVDFDPAKGLFFFVDLKNYLEEIICCKIDLVTKDALHPALKKRILREAKHVF